MKEYEEIGYWLSGYIDGVLAVLDDTRESMMAVTELLKEMPRIFHMRFIEKETEL